MHDMQKGGSAVRMELMENGCLRILLTEEDLHVLGLTFDSLDYDNVTTREAMQELLLMARNEAGFDQTGDMMVEALPVDGGALLLFTPTGIRRRARMKRAIGPYIYEVDDVDQLLRLADGWGRFSLTAGKKSIPSGSSLYCFGTGYRLVLYPFTPLPRNMVNFLREFSHSAGEGDAAAAYTAEHGKPIAVGDALVRLCAAMNHAPPPQTKFE